MADPVTNNYSLVLPTVGGDSGTWGGVQNNGIFSPVDAILGANLPVTINAADVNLTTSQFQNAIFVLTGVLTGNRSLIIPLSTNSATLACGGRFVVVNNTTGGFSVTVKTVAAGSLGVTVPQGAAAFLYSDQTNVGFASSGLPGFAAAVAGNPNGLLAGTAGSITTNASLAYDYTNNNFYVCTTTGNAAGAVWTAPSPVVARGFDTAFNLQLFMSHTGGNLLSVAVKAANTGLDATPSNPVGVAFQALSGVNTTGAPVNVNITAALSMTTAALGASLGSSANTAFRIWFAVFNNAGTPVLAMRNCSNATSIFSLAESGVASTVAASAAATSAGVWYTPSGITLTNCAFRVIGYCEYTAGLATPGTYSSDPTNTVLFGPGIKKPGDLVQSIYTSTSANIQTANVFNTNSNVPPTTAAGAQALSATITPSSPLNHLRIRSQMTILSQAACDHMIFLIGPGSATAIAANYGGGANASNLGGGAEIEYEALIGAGGTYSVWFTGGTATGINGSNTSAVMGGVGNATMHVQEIMG